MVMTSACRYAHTTFSCVTHFAYLTACIATCVAISGDLFAAANNLYCTNNVKQHHIAFSSGTLQKAPLNNGAEIAFSRRELKTGIITSNEQNRSMSVDLNFQYTIIDVDDSITPMSNGHLHSWNFPVSWYHQKPNYTLDYFLAPVLSVSSNALKNHDLIDGDAMQLWTGVVYKKNISKNNAWLIGLRSDHRFGPYRIYPVAGFCWQPAENWQIQLAFPDTSVQRFFSNGISLKLYVQPDGNKWHVFSKDLTRSSDFFYNAIVTGLSLEWRINPTLWVDLSTVNHSNRNFRFTLDNGSQLDMNESSSMGLTLSAGLLF